jgi:hypothetical protein
MQSLSSHDRDMLGSEIAGGSSPVSKALREQSRVLLEEMLTLPPDTVVAPIGHGCIRRATFSVTLQSGKSMPKMDGACPLPCGGTYDESLPTMPEGVPGIS